MTLQRYDVVLMSDLRYPGGNSASIAEEVKAQHAAGYTTALVHVPAPHMSSLRCLNRKIAHCVETGLADLLPPHRRVQAGALVIRQPRVLAQAPAVEPRVEADVTLLVVNQGPTDGLQPAARPYYDVATVRDRAEALYGDVLWAPIGPSVRDALTRTGTSVRMRATDWFNILDVDEWRTDRTRFAADRPVIGRHSRGDRAKWPVDPAEILAAYPDDDALRVEILGGADPAVHALGRRPGNWTVHPFGSMTPRDFLRRIDFFVYYHHPGWIEAFGRNVIEAMASGCPVILPPHFESTFGDGAHYAQPAGVRAIVERLYDDPAAYRERSAAAREHVERNFAAPAHERRLRELIGDPSGPPARPPRRRPRRMLLVSTVPEGAGSATRLLRAAERLPEDVEPVLLLAAPALALAAAATVLCELLPQDDAEIEPATMRRIDAVARRHGAEAVLVDGPLPAPAALAGRRVVWMPPAGAATSRPPGSAAVAAVVALSDLPGDPPDGVRLVMRAAGEPLGRAAARAALGIQEGDERPLALLVPGADERVTSAARVWTAAQALLETGWGVVFPEPLIATGTTRLPDGVVRAPLRPLWRHLPGFDAVVGSPGHTLVHELIAARVPSLLVPLRSARREPERAAAAAALGVALAPERFDAPELERALTTLRDPAARTALAGACGAIALDDAAPAAAEALEAAALARAGWGP